MNIIFYKCKSPKKSLNKILTNNKTVTGYIMEECDLINPVIRVNNIDDIYTYNYAYIEAFKRYYYITNVKVENKIILLTMHVDVLMSYREDIANSKAIITRANLGDNYIPDTMVIPTKKLKRQCQQIGTPFTKNEKYVIQIGG